MFQSVFAREQGLEPSWLLARRETIKKTYALDISLDREFANTFSSNVHSMAMDIAGDQFLISVAEENKIAIFDTFAFPKSSQNIPACTATKESTRGSSIGFHKHMISAIEWFPRDTGLFFTSGLDGFVKVWDTNEMMPCSNFRLKSKVFSLALSPCASSHNLIAAGTEESAIRLCDMRSGTSTHILQGHDSSVYDLKWSPRGENNLVSGSRDNRILLWDIRKTNRFLSSFKASKTKGSKKRKTTESDTAHRGAVNGLCFTDDGLGLLSIGRDGKLRLWDVHSTTNTLVHYEGINHTSASKHASIAVSLQIPTPLVYICSDNDILVFEVHTGALVHTFKGHYDRVSSLAFHPKFPELYSGGRDNQILAWSPLSDKEREEENVGQEQEDPAFTHPDEYEDEWSDSD